MSACARASIVAFVFALSAVPAAAQPAAAPFRSGVVVLRVDAIVTDGAGRPVRDLKASDFSVEVDGESRKVLFAQFSGPDDETVAGGSAGEPLPGAYALNTAAAAGRAVVFVLDLESIRPGTEKTLLDTAAQLVESLGPADAVALVPIPGTSVPLTRDRSQVAQKLRTLQGTEHAPTIRHFFTITEAAAFEKGDKRVMAEVVERECSVGEAYAQQLSGSEARCPNELQVETRERLRFARMHVQTLLTGISGIVPDLQRIDAPKTIVLISGGLPSEIEGLTWFNQVGRDLTRAGALLYAVHVDQPDSDASTASRPGIESYASRDREAGLANLATATGGAFFFGVGKAKGVFDRLRGEIAHSYQLGIESKTADADGKPRSVRVQVQRPGASVRWRHDVLASERSADPSRRLTDLLAQPVNVADLPIAAAAYTVRGEDPTTVKVIVAGEIARGATATPPIRFALALLKDGKSVGGSEGTATDQGDGARVLATAQLEPGRYRARLAAVDADGRGGVLDIPIGVGLRAAGDLQASDVILGPAGDALTPAIHAYAAAPLGAGLELYSADPARFAQAAVSFEVRRRGDETVRAAAEAQLSATPLERQQIARAAIPVSNLAPGDYTVSAIVKLDGRPVGRVSRAFVLAPGAPPSAAAAATPAAQPPAPAAEAVPLDVQDPTLEPVLRRMGNYIAAYGERTSVIVATEKYTQHVTPERSQPLPPRQLVAEFALVKTAGEVGWAGYRDVIEVNGVPIQDRRDRLMRLFTEATGTVAEANRIANESARFNIGPIARNFNVPTTALFFFHPANLARFTFRRKGTGKIDGVPVWEISFRETKKPTLVATRAGKDVPCEGTLWVVPEDGTVVRTRLQFRGFADQMALSDPKAPPSPGMSQQVFGSPAPAPAPPGGGQTPAPGAPGGTPGTGGTGTGSSSGSGQTSGGATGGGSTAGARANPRRSFGEYDLTRLDSRASIDVTYRRDDKLGMWLPSKMSEEYEGAIPLIRSTPLYGVARSTATYSDFKQFETSATLKAPKS